MQPTNCNLREMPRGSPCACAGSHVECDYAITIYSRIIAGSPISTTHTLVGAISGVGLVKGFEKVNTKIIRSILDEISKIFPTQTSVLIDF